MAKLRIADGVVLPLDAVTQAIGVLAKRRVGKSYTARRFAEQLLKADQQVVIVDPKGDHWGIRSSADGKGPGFPVVILGGEHGDVPLEVNSGEIVAKLVVEERVSALLDLSLFRKHERTTFMTAFMETLYRLKAQEKFRTAMMLIIDEADEIIPQKPQTDEHRMLGAGDDIVRRGGQRGIGCMLVTQRSAVINKNVLTQCEMLIVLRTIAPQDLDAMQAWVDVHGTPDERETLMASLPSLPKGDAWFWSPGWPTEDGIFVRAHVHAIETFDSGATPKPGEKRIQPKNLADVDLAALTKQMASVIEKKKATDPKELQRAIAEKDKEIAALKKHVERVQRGTPITSVVVDNSNARELKTQITRLRKALDLAMKIIINVSTANFDVAGVDKAELQKGIEAAVERASKIVDQKLDARARQLEQLKTTATRALAALGDVLKDDTINVDVAVTKNEPYTVGQMQENHPRRPAPPPRAPIAHRRDGELAAGPQKLLDAAAALAAVNITGPTRAQVAALAGISPTSSATERHFALLTKEKGYFDIPEAGRVSLSAAGAAAATAVDFPPSLEDYIAQWQRLLGTGADRKLFDAMSIHPKAPNVVLSREELSQLAGISNTSSATERGYAWLIGLDLLAVAGKGMVKAGPTMFPEGLI